MKNKREGGSSISLLNGEETQYCYRTMSATVSKDLHFVRIGGRLDLATCVNVAIICPEIHDAVGLENAASVQSSFFFRNISLWMESTTQRHYS